MCCALSRARGRYEPPWLHGQAHEWTAAAGLWWYIGTVRQPHTIDEYVARYGEGYTGVPSSWVYYYQGLEYGSIWADSVPINKQYLVAFYWSASTLSCSSLVGDATPKNAVEILFTIWCALPASLPSVVLHPAGPIIAGRRAAMTSEMQAWRLFTLPPCRSMLTTLTMYAYVMGEITNMVMDSDAALVQKREEVARVQTFIAKHDFPPDLAQVRVRSVVRVGSAEHWCSARCGTSAPCAAGHRERLPRLLGIQGRPGPHAGAPL